MQELRRVVEADFGSQWLLRLAVHIASSRGVGARAETIVHVHYLSSSTPSKTVTVQRIEGVIRQYSRPSTVVIDYPYNDMNINGEPILARTSRTRQYAMSAPTRSCHFKTPPFRLPNRVLLRFSELQLLVYFGMAWSESSRFLDSLAYLRYLSTW